MSSARGLIHGLLGGRCLKMYLGLCFYSGGVRPTDRTTAIEKVVFFSRFPRGGDKPLGSGHVGERQGRSGGGGREERVCVEALIVVSWGRGRQAGDAARAGLGLDCLGDFGRF